MIVQHHEARTGREVHRLLRAALQGKRRASEDHGIAIHPYISGQPFRIKYLEMYTVHRQFKGVLH